MSPSVGIVASFVALLSWGFGDFFIQRSVRAVGSLAALLCITAFGSVVLLPFVWEDLPLLATSEGVWVVVGATLITLITALIEFEAFRKGKLSVIEPIMSFELVVTAMIGLAFLGESISAAQTILALVIFLGILLTVVQKGRTHFWQRWFHRSRLEQGVLLGVIGMLLMSVTNIMTGLASQQTTALLAIWGIHTGLALLSLFALLLRGTVQESFQKIRVAWKPVLAQSVFDNTAWIAYAVAVQTLPISITIAITESYIALAALLGIALNRERLQRHQYFGMALALGSAILLAGISL